MESYIQISKLNDFIFCPTSLYFHSLYEGFSQKVYHYTPQTVGKIKHENIDEGRYSSRKRYIQNLSVYSEKYNLMGKIDIYDREEKALIERKFKIKKIYDGQRYQLYAQMFCMREMGWEVEKLYIHSLSDNRRYPVGLPDEKEMAKFETLIDDMNNFDSEKYRGKISENKCDNCIYRELCNVAVENE
jgi:CRISPR-associated exonuclease Cas4